jgi:hypothetical protein
MGCDLIKRGTATSKKTSSFSDAADTEVQQTSAETIPINLSPQDISIEVNALCGGLSSGAGR